MAFFAFRFVSINLFTSNHSVDRDPLADVYFYNFPDDRRALKILGEYFHSLVDSTVTVMTNHN